MEKIEKDEKNSTPRGFSREITKDFRQKLFEFKVNPMSEALHLRQSNIEKSYILVCAFQNMFLFVRGLHFP